MATAAAMAPTTPQQTPTIAVQRSSLDGLSVRTSNDAQWGAHFWVTLSDPQVCLLFFYSFIQLDLSRAELTHSHSPYP